MRRLLPRLALTVGALLAVLVAGEVGLRVLHALGSVPRVRAEDVFPRSSYGARLVRSDDPELYLELDPSDPLVNSHGFRDREYALERPPDVIRVLALGDSVTYGIGIPTEATWPKVLEIRLERPGSAPWQVLNLAVPGYGTAEELRLFETRGRRWRPDALVVGYNLNDPMASTALTHTLARRMEREAFFRGWLAWSHLMSLAYERWTRLQSPVLHRCYESEKLTNALRSALDGFARIHREEVPVLFAIFPQLEDFDDYPYRDLHAWVAGELRGRELPMVDLLPAFSRHPAGELRVQPRDTGHPNELGHRLAALQIQAPLVELLAGSRPQAPVAAQGDGAGR